MDCRPAASSGLSSTDSLSHDWPPASRTANATIYGTVQLPSKRAGFVSQGNLQRESLPEIVSSAGGHQLPRDLGRREAKPLLLARPIACNHWSMSSTPIPDRAVPNLPSRNFDETETFYISFGFERVFRDEGWMILARGSVQLEFFPFPDVDPQSSNFMCCLRVADVDELYDAIRRSGVTEATAGMPRLHPVRMQEWGLRAGYLIDADGTQLTLIEQPGLTEA